MSFENISKLTDMGFSEEQAILAMKATNGNVEQAIAYLFEEPIEVDPPERMPDPSLYESTVNVQNPESIPDFSEYQNSQASRSHQHIEEQQTEASPSPSDYQNKYEDSLDFNPYEKVVGIYDDLTNSKRSPVEPPVVLIDKAGFLENYLMPLIIILSQIDKFKSLAFRRSDFDYGYEKDWYTNRSKLMTEIPEELFDEQATSFRFLLELQRILGYLSGMSNRAYISSKILFKNLPDDLKKELASRIEEVEDFIDKFYTCLDTNFVSLFGGQNEFDSLLKSTVESVSDEVRNEISILTIEYESRTNNIYQSLNGMFWNDEDSIGDIRFVNIAPVVTVQLKGDEMEYTMNPFQLQEYFYPEIYGAKYSSLIAEMYSKRTTLVNERNLLTRELMSLNVFEGKKIKSLLQRSIEQLSLSGNEEATADLTNLNEKVSDEREILADKLSELNSLYTKLDINNYENVLEEISKSGLEPPKLYILVGIIVSDTSYYYKSKKYNNDGEDWVYFNSTHTRQNDIIDYGLETMNFAVVQQQIYELTKYPKNLAVLIYASNTLYEEKLPIDMSDELKSFFVKDNEEFEIQLKNLESESSDDSENEDLTPDESSDQKENQDQLIDL